MLRIIGRLLKDERGATAIEYGLIAAMGNVGNNLQTIFNSVAGNLNT